MADSTLAALAAHTPAVDADSLYIENVGVAKKVAASVLKTYVSASPTLVTPNIGTPSAGVITACTGAPALAITNMTGTGTNLTFVNPALGTPASGVATNLTGAPTLAITNMTGTGTNLTFVNPALGTPASGVATNLTGAPALEITNMTGTGTNLTFVTPALGTPASGVLTNCTGAPTFTLAKRSVAAGVTAAVGSAQGDGPITTDVVQISVCANAGDAVTLPTAAAGLEITIVNNGAQACDVFPAAGDDAGAGADTAVSLAAGSNITYVAYNATNWFAAV